MKTNLSNIESLEMTAKSYGLENLELVQTTIARYKTEMLILMRLQSEIESTNTMTSKEYVKGRQNILVNPAITEYGKHTTIANNTGIALTKILYVLDKKKKEIDKTHKRPINNVMKSILGDD